jgi:hypothetical protein
MKHPARPLVKVAGPPPVLVLDLESAHLSRRLRRAGQHSREDRGRLEPALLERMSGNPATIPGSFLPLGELGKFAGDYQRFRASETSSAPPLASAEPRLGLATRVCYCPQMERVVQVFSSLADADSADEEYYANLSPSERVDILLDLIEQHRSSLGAAADRLERVCRIAQLSQG